MPPLRDSLSDSISDAVDLDSLSSAVQLPDVSSLNMPDVSALNMPDLSSIDASSFQDNPAALAAIGLAALAAVGAASAGGESSGSSTAGGGPKRRSGKQAAAIAIPYHAAARLAYEEWCKEHKEKSNEAGFLAFQEIYESEAVAQVKAKKLHRDLDTFSNEGKKPIPPRKITTTPVPKKEPAPDFFFADPVTN